MMNTPAGCSLADYRNKEAKAIVLKRGNNLIRNCLLTNGGLVVHEKFQSAAMSWIPTSRLGLSVFRVTRGKSFRKQIEVFSTSGISAVPGAFSLCAAGTVFDGLVTP